MSVENQASTGLSIYPFQNAEIDSVYRSVIVPTLRAHQLTPFTLNSSTDVVAGENLDLIRRSDIVTPEIAGAGPSHWLLIGYFAGAQRTNRLILPERRGIVPDGSLISAIRSLGMKPVMWNPQNLSDFQLKLDTEILDRKLARHPLPANSHPEGTWIEANRRRALEGLSSIGKKGFMEISVLPTSPVI